MTNRPSTAIDQLSNQYVTSLLDCTPELVTALGRGSADEGDFSDYSPRASAR
ncbi:hypothetical protein QEV70_08245 [Trueperella pyogenes]|uniref:hypothetical protein n=1 Tax=Trueperella pyogenes TaxID=1661 RepID=UPI0032491900